MLVLFVVVVTAYIAVLPDRRDGESARSPMAGVQSPASLSPEEHELKKPQERRAIDVDKHDRVDVTRTRQEEPRVTGSVQGYVLGPNEERVTPAVVVLARGESTHEAQVDSHGVFSFEGVDSGEYVLTVEEDSLPPEYRPPFRQDQIVNKEWKDSCPPGYFATVVELGDGEAKWQNLHVHLTDHNDVHGTVRGPGGEPIPGAMVRIMSLRPGLQSLTEDSRTDEHGYFRMEDIIPGKYVVQLFFDRDSPEAVLSRPRPRRIEVGPGTSTDIEYTLGAGPYEIRGQVINQDSLPFSGVHVLCYHWEDPEALPEGGAPFTWSDVASTAVTDEEGRFVLSNLYSGRVGIQIEPDGYSPSRKVWENKTTGWIPPVEVDLSGSRPVVFLDPVVLDENRPFKIEGRILLGEGPVKPTVFEVRVVDGPELITIPVSKQGSFLWGCTTPHGPLNLIVLRGESPVYAETLFPEPNRTKRLEVPGTGSGSLRSKTPR